MTLTRYLYKEVKLKTTGNLRYQPFKIQLSKAAQGRKISGTVCLFFEEKSGALTFEFGAPHYVFQNPFWVGHNVYLQYQLKKELSKVVVSLFARPWL